MCLAELGYPRSYVTISHSFCEQWVNTRWLYVDVGGIVDHHSWKFLFTRHCTLYINIYTKGQLGHNDHMIHYTKGQLGHNDHMIHYILTRL